MPILSGTLGAGFFGKVCGKRFCSFAMACSTGSTGLAGSLTGFAGRAEAFGGARRVLAGREV